MTKQEYDAKAENGTLTVRDVIKHREFATPEQLAIIDEYFKAELPTPDEFAEDMRLFGEFLDRVDREITELEHDATTRIWDTMGDEPEAPGDAGTLDGKACNTDCLAYARGTCGYINAATISQPAEAYNLKDKRTCPRYREIYPERV